MAQVPRKRLIPEYWSNMIIFRILVGCTERYDNNFRAYTFIAGNNKNNLTSVTQIPDRSHRQYYIVTC